MATVTWRADRRGGRTSRGSPSVLPIKLSHQPPGSSARATFARQSLSVAWFTVCSRPQMD